MDWKNEDKAKQLILEGLHKLDFDNDEHWTKQGQPNIYIMRQLTGIEELSRAHIIKVAPELMRDTPEKLPDLNLSPPPSSPQDSDPGAPTAEKPAQEQESPTEPPVDTPALAPSADDQLSELERAAELAAKAANDAEEAKLKAQAAYDQLVAKKAKLERPQSERNADEIRRAIEQSKKDRIARMERQVVVKPSAASKLDASLMHTKRDTQVGVTVRKS